MNIINLQTGEPFDAAPRMHHRELAVEGASSVGSRTRNLLGLRGAMMGGGSAKWTNPYVTDGLIAMWDGEWNAGGGVHDATATTWTDISNNGYDATCDSMPTWGDNFVWKFNTFSLAKSIFSGLDYFTVETVWETSSAVNGYAGVLSTSTNSNYGGNIAVGRWNNNNLIYAAIGGKNLVWDTAGYGLRQSSTSYVDGTAYLKRNSATCASGSVTETQLASFRGQALWYVAYNSEKTAENKFHSIRVYSRELTTTEVAANYAVDKARFGLT